MYWIYGDWHRCKWDFHVCCCWSIGLNSLFVLPFTNIRSIDLLYFRLDFRFSAICIRWWTQRNLIACYFCPVLLFPQIWIVVSTKSRRIARLHAAAGCCWGEQRKDTISHKKQLLHNELNAINLYTIEKDRTHTTKCNALLWPIFRKSILCKYIRRTSVCPFECVCVSGIHTFGTHLPCHGYVTLCFYTSVDLVFPAFPLSPRIQL